MKRTLLIKFLAIVPVIALLCVVVYATAFMKQVAVVGGGARRLSTVLSNANYTSSSGVLELNVCNPSDAPGTLYVGSNSNVNATTGSRLVQSQCIRFAATGATGDIGVKTDDFYLFTSANQNAEVWLRTR